MSGRGGGAQGGDRGDLTSFPLVGWVASLPGVQRRLRAGARVAAVGCGAGQALIELADAYPRSTFHGFDADPVMIDSARVASAEAGVSDRVTFEVAPPTRFPGAGYDLICGVAPSDGHDAALLLADRIRRAVVDGGTWLLCAPGDGLARGQMPVRAGGPPRRPARLTDRSSDRG